jgi:hypothetical protein
VVVEAYPEMEKMPERTVKSHGYKSRTPWLEAIREVPSAWLEDEAKNSSSPYSLLASWKGQRGGVPSHVMIKLIRRRLREYSPELVQTALPPASLQRAQDMLKEIWARTGRAGDRQRIWRLVEGLLRMVSEHVGGRPG